MEVAAWWDEIGELMRRKKQGGTVEWEMLTINASMTPAWKEQAMNDQKSVSLQFSLKRKPAYYIDYVIIPMLLMVAIAWSSFFITRSAVPARVAVAIIGYLTMSNM